ncbi:FKBP-type peptidyl-prolyl cis-trans isomerase [Sansalvadorimonas verongulae]|uniref:FKBP-type peptidyl-prolyl cis-trans isomerase n=1 Tax=Sansalvadorimonas verongulae TaxID=2172824 RepID=UPI002E335701|nr:FKBP-type peptidyl-prolyl cis-trans isomerase [Sansalvadorimonas verongulae]MTI12351.1 FKBP-type peptidyl-prolyl cis-trans isomerase [Sansalvadorimonas verongulae]
MSNILLYVLIAIAVVFGLWHFNQKKQLGQEALTAGQAFLASNKNKEGVHTTESGLQYKILHKGEGGPVPSATSKVKVHYHGTLVNGKVFDSSVDRGQPISFGLNQVIPGWTEGLQLMSVGDKYRLFIPASLAYGSQSMGGIPANSTLIFDVELLGIEP